jgi:signal transduction histidine kinase
LALAVPHGASITLDSDILDAFVERITLAIENASLYRTLAGRSNDLQRAYSDLAAAHQELLGVDEMKTNFLANVSHELRTPLTSIRSFSELLLAYEDDAAVHKEFLRIINSESERLTRLVNDVLDITKIEAGHMDWQMAMLNLPDLLRDSARTFGPLIAKGKLTFDLDIDDDLPPIYGDRDRLHQVVANLLNNAMKFTHVGTITLRADRQDDVVVITVCDTGIGIADEDQERIFEKFQQVGDTLTDKPRGTGLGLAICRDIVEYHQGRLAVESEPGQGSTFTVALPISSAASLELAA